MTRKRKYSKSGLDLLIATPWWVPAIAALGGFVAFQWVIPAVAATNPILIMFSQTVRPFGFLLSTILGLIALVNFFRQRRSQITPTTLFSKARSQPTPFEDSVAKSPEPKPAEWSLELLRKIEWKRFEELSAAYYRETGFRSETIRCGADGGVDAKLFRANSNEPVAVIQCKAWNSRPVGVKPVRELLGVMAHQKIPRGIFIATGDFTKEAVEFAKANPIDLVCGSAFMGMIRKLPTDAQLRLLAVATEGEFTVPTCPSCGIKMIWRNSDRGGFWGCAHYPRCRQTFFLTSAQN